ncbi:hypothetical protein ACERK3_17530 [Phycisphaerales bacterium AB-hyl4]|uniref:Concanavalin A-like lectin/glucanase superfamily protein n=1 Tax=Natronomicrosphaera hydrolytica TaxID=3242702 RepID=A0ABV4U8Z3_9BACT
MRRSQWLAVTLTPLCLVALLAVQAQAGQVTYPALGNIDPERGTIEMWLVPQFDPDADIEGHYRGRRLFLLEQEQEHTFFQLIWRTRRQDDGSQRSGPWIRASNEGEQVVVMARLWHVSGEDDDGWREGEPRHFALSWDGREMWVTVDGRETKREPMRRPLGVQPDADMKIVLGHSGENSFVIHDFRISSLPREPEELGYHYPDGLRPDPWTLLLDTFREPFEVDGQRQTRPYGLTPSHDQDGGLPSEGARFIETSLGMGLNL